jgi:ATP-dependent helicase/DNAse subunit B
MAHRLLLGEPGSGKTTAILNEIRAAFRRGDSSFRLLVPTATMAEHLRHLLAREGLAVRPSAIQTLAAFLEDLVPGVSVVSSAILSRLTARAIQASRPAAFETLLDSPGFASALTRALEDLANAGCDALQWSALRGMNVVSGGVAQAIGEVYEGLERELAAGGFSLRAAQLARAAAPKSAPPPGFRRVFWDGFFTFSRYELEVVRALAAHGETWVALPEWPGARDAIETLKQSGFREHRFTVLRKQPASFAIEAPTLDDEAEDIARRIREEAARGRPWREMAVVLRDAETYVPLLRTTFARFGIPGRFYFARPLLSHPAARLLVNSVEALLSGWDHDLTLRALLSEVTPAGRCPEAGRFENKVREGLPAKGLAALRGGAVPAIIDAISKLAAWEPWASESVPPAEWAARLLDYETLVAVPGSNEVLLSRERAAALAAVRQALGEAASLLPAQPITLAAFWSEALPILSASALRPADYRRDTVAVIDVHEARQWELPVVFVCGLLEGEFPRAAGPDPILGEETRLRLNRAGIPLATRADRDQEEHFLFKFALTRATETLHLSWPAANESGEPNLRSFALDAAPFDLAKPQPSHARKVRLRPTRTVNLLPRPAILDDNLLNALRARYLTLRATGIESFLQCPYQFFARTTLGIQPLPPTPSERLTPLVEGILIHSVIAAWHRNGGRLPEIFDREWQRTLRRHRIPEGYRTEFSRALIERSLRFYEEKCGLEPGWEVHPEQDITLDLDGVTILGRIDRYDTNEAGQCAVYDFKFSGKSSLRNREKKQEAGLFIQGGLYSAALRQAGLTPISFRYIGLRGDTNWGVPVEGADLTALIGESLRISGDAAFRIRQGEIAVRPADPDACQYCEFLTACRVAEAAAEAEAAAS